GPGAASGAVSFSHEIIADYLAARAAVRAISLQPDNPVALGQAIGLRADLEPITRSVYLRTLVHALSRDRSLAAAVLETAQSSRIARIYKANVDILARELLRGVKAA
ncbi:MAG TPA: hypothetical protein PK264_23145, partial [Hyphomicrobiaceae bacterium]|nr:hypothetical protein [Hyphomicrobiaceae bacterium]